MSTELDRIMAKMAADGITISTKLAPGVPVTDRPAVRIRDAAERAGIAYDDTDVDTLPSRAPYDKCSAHLYVEAGKEQEVEA